MVWRRLATAVVAAGLVVGAFLVRRNVIEGDEPDATDGPDPATELVCVTELEAACNAIGGAHPELAVTVEDARVTLDRVAGGEAVPLWLTFEPFPAMAGTLAAGDVLGAAELAIATPPGRQDVLAAKCADQPLWRCVGDLAGEEWGEVPGVIEPSVGDAGTTAAGLASFASAVAGYFDTTQLSRTVWETEPEFIPWVRRLVRAVPVEELTAGTPLATMLTRPSAVNVAATNDAELAALGARGGEVEPGYPEPSMWLQAVLAAPAGADIPQDLATDTAAALVQAGWVPPESTTQTPLPSSTTMLALRGLWEEVQ